MKKTVISGIIQYLKDPLHKNAIFLIATHAAFSIVGLAFWIIAARWYTDSEVGTATALISAVLLLQTFSKLGLDIGLIRFLPDAEDKQRMINTCLTLVGLFSIVLAVIFILGLDFWSPDLASLQDSLGYSVLFVLSTGFTSLDWLFRQSIFVAYRATEFSLVTQLAAALRLPFLLLLKGVGTYGIFVSWGLGLGASLLGGLILLLRLQPSYRPTPRIDKTVVKQMLNFSSGNYVAESLRELPGFLLPLLIVNILTSDMAAYFYMPWTIATMVFMISYAIGFSLLAEGSYQPARLPTDVVRAVKFVLLLMIPAMLVIVFFGDKILLIFGREYSENGFDLLRILAFSGIPLAVNSLYVSVKRIQRQVRPVILVYAVVALLTIGIGSALMKDHELTGVGIAWLSSNAIVALVILLTITARKIWPWRSVA